MAALEWSDAQCAELRRLWLARPVISSAAISNRMGTSQGSILRRVRMLELPPRESPGNVARWAMHNRITPPPKEPARAKARRVVAHVETGTGACALQKRARADPRRQRSWLPLADVGHTKPKTPEYWARVHAGKVVECGAPRTMRTLPTGWSVHWGCIVPSTRGAPGRGCQMMREEMAYRELAAIVDNEQRIAAPAAGTGCGFARASRLVARRL